MNAENFRAISKSVQKAWGFRSDPKASQFERALPGGLSNEEGFCLGHPQLFGCMMLITMTSPKYHLKPKAIPTGGWHGKEIEGSEER